jgi:iron complex transport system permease protein
LVLPLLAAAVALLVIVALRVGAYRIPLGTLWQGLLGGELADQAATVLFQVRLPRIGTALVTGAALAAAGATYQGLFRNPLVSPDVLGVSTGAGLGAVLGIFLALPVIGSVAGAAISLLKVLADPYDQLPAITFWLLGSLASITPQDALSAVPLVLASLIPLGLLRWHMNLMALGDEEAMALGVDARHLRRVFVAAATLMTAAVVAVAGVIGWVGLVVPHLARLLVGPDYRVLLPASILLGAGYLLAVDTLARTLTTVEVPLGILTALLGAPFFLWLLATGRRGWA